MRVRIELSGKVATEVFQLIAAPLAATASLKRVTHEFSGHGKHTLIADFDDGSDYHAYLSAMYFQIE